MQRSDRWWRRLSNQFFGDPSSSRMGDGIVGMHDIDSMVAADFGDSRSQWQGVVRTFEQGEFYRGRFAEMDIRTTVIEPKGGSLGYQIDIMSQVG